MKATELMIWDWVRSTVSGKAYQVLEIGDPFVLVDNPGGVWLRTIGMRYRIVEPIPLTAEILDKNGWLYMSMGDEYCTPDDDISYKEPFRLQRGLDGNAFWWIVGNSIICPVNYVHELQHALRLCGLDDLADNLKV